MTDGALRRRRGAGFAIALTLIAALLVTGLCGLGVWQVHRLAWKRDLIARVDARIHAAPAPAPARAGRRDDYRRVFADGHFVHDRTILVQAATIGGSGYWVMTPLRLRNGTLLLVNRGFVPPDSRTRYDRPQGAIRVAGLLRLSEPGGGFLRANDPAHDRWYSRDVSAIAAKRNLTPAITSYFIDAEAGPTPDALPVGGLTVVQFPDNHLAYAITWFMLAAMGLAAYIFVMREFFQDRRP